MSRIARSKAAAQALVMSLHQHQKIIEVVGHSAGQLADSFHFLRLAELVLQAFVLGHVIEHALHQQRAVVGLVQHDGFVAKPQHPSVAREHAVLSLKQLVRFLKALFCSQRDFAIVLVDAVHPIHGIREPLGGRETKDGLDLRTYIVPGSAGAEFRDVGHSREALDQRAVAVLGGAELNLGTIMFDGNRGQVGSMAG